jgi:hypothetical protein
MDINVRLTRVDSAEHLASLSLLQPHIPANIGYSKNDWQKAREL